MDGNVEKALIENQNVFDHVAIGFALLVAVEIVPTQTLQTRFKSHLHRLQLFIRYESREGDDAVLVKLLAQFIHLATRCIY